MLSLTRNGTSKSRRGRAQASKVECLEERRLLTAAPTLLGATVNVSGSYATWYVDATADSGSATLKLKALNNGTWQTFGTTSGGGGSTWHTVGSQNYSLVTAFEVTATEGGVESSASNVVNVESSTATPVGPSVENATNDGGSFDFNWTGSTAYRDTDTLRLQYATTTTAGTVWTDYGTTNAAVTAPDWRFSLNDQQTTEFRIRVENSNGDSSWTTFTIDGLSLIHI